MTEQTTQGVTYEVVHRHFTSWKQVSSFELVLYLLVLHFGDSRRRFATLFGVLVSCAQWAMVQFCGCRLETTTAFACAKVALSKHPLHSFHANMSQATMPTWKFLLDFGQIGVIGRDQ